MPVELMKGNVAIAEAAFWWLDHYRSFEAHLSAKSELCFKNDAVMIFDIRHSAPSPG